MSNRSETSLKEALLRKDPQFWTLLAEAALAGESLDQLIFLSALAKKARAQSLLPPATSQGALRLALLGSYTFHPFKEVLETLLVAAGFSVQIWVGDFDNYTQEIVDENSGLYTFKPNVVLIAPSGERCVYSGRLDDSQAKADKEIRATVNQLITLVKKVHDQTGADVILTNFVLPGGFDPGAWRGRTLTSEWSFKKAVNTLLGLEAPPFVHICDAEFLSCRRGLVASRDNRLWLSSRQFGSAELIADWVKETTSLVVRLRRGIKKVLVVDLDNTLWGGVLADEGVEGIELGEGTPRGEAFKNFQRQVKALSKRGVLLAVCSKNDENVAKEPFGRHPEMVLTFDDFVAFKANWLPKPENLRAIAKTLGLGLDSFVFVDDNPAEIEIVRQMTPEVQTVCLGEDPATFVEKLQDLRAFEPLQLTAEDRDRSEMYRQETQRKQAQSEATDLDSFLASLEMKATFQQFLPEDIPRIAQLINKSNQFNLTTRRRTETEVAAIATDPRYVTLTVRLADRFGDYGLVGVVIGHLQADRIEIDTWLMSCRVLQRGMEKEMMNEVFRLAKSRGSKTVSGEFIPTEKNSMVRDFYPTHGFQSIPSAAPSARYQKSVNAYATEATKIEVLRRAYESDRDLRPTAKRVR